MRLDETRSLRHPESEVQWDVHFFELINQIERPVKSERDWVFKTLWMNHSCDTAHLPAHVPLYHSVYLSIYLPMYQPIYLSTCLSTYLAIYLPIYHIQPLPALAKLSLESNMGVSLISSHFNIALFCLLHPNFIHPSWWDLWPFLPEGNLIWWSWCSVTPLGAEEWRCAACFFGCWFGKFKWRVRTLGSENHTSSL